MNNDTRVFTERTFFVLKIMTAICAAIFVIAALYVAVGGMPLFTFENELGEGGVLLAIIFGVGLFTILVTFLALSVTPQRTVVCGAEKCEITVTNFWKSRHEYDSFRWDEVTDTNLVEAETPTGTDGGVISTYFFVIQVGEQEKWLLNVKSSSGKVISEMIRLINESTPQLNYVWEKTADFGSRQVIAQVQKYSKVARA